MCAVVVVLGLFICLLPTIFPKIDSKSHGDLGGASGVGRVLWPICFMLGFVSDTWLSWWRSYSCTVYMFSQLSKLGKLFRPLFSLVNFNSFICPQDPPNNSNNNNNNNNNNIPSINQSINHPYLWFSDASSNHECFGGEGSQTAESNVQEGYQPCLFSVLDLTVPAADSGAILLGRYCSRLWKCEGHSPVCKKVSALV